MATESSTADREHFYRVEGSRVLEVFHLFSYLSNVQFPLPYKRFLLHPQTLILPGLRGGSRRVAYGSGPLHRLGLSRPSLCQPDSLQPTSLDFLSCLLGRQMESRQRGRHLCWPQTFTAGLPAALLARETLGPGLKLLHPLPPIPFSLSPAQDKLSFLCCPATDKWLSDSCICRRFVTHAAATSPGQGDAEGDETGKAPNPLLSQLPLDRCDYGLLCHLKDRGLGEGVLRGEGQKARYLQDTQWQSPRALHSQECSCTSKPWPMPFPR